MKNTFLWLLLIVAAIVSCTSGDVTGSRQLSPEQERLEKINMIDSTSLCEILHLDSIEGYELLNYRQRLQSEVGRQIYDAKPD